MDGLEEKKEKRIKLPEEFIKKKHLFGCIVFSCGTWDLHCVIWDFVVHGLCSCGVRA